MCRQCSIPLPLGRSADPRALLCSLLLFDGTGPGGGNRKPRCLVAVGERRLVPRPYIAIDDPIHHGTTYGATLYIWTRIVSSMPSDIRKDWKITSNS